MSYIDIAKFIMHRIKEKASTLEFHVSRVEAFLRRYKYHHHQGIAFASSLYARINCDSEIVLFTI